MKGRNPIPLMIDFQDGGDCLKGGKVRGEYDSGSNNDWSHNSASHTAPTEQCTPGCQGSWLGDRYCDKACRHVDCGMDAGDCGTDALLAGVPGVHAYQGMNTLDPANLSSTGAHPMAIYLNLSTVFPGENDTIVDAVHDGYAAFPQQHFAFSPTLSVSVVVSVSR